MAVRKRSRRDDGTIVSESVASQDVTEPNVARLMQIMLMLAQGKTQAQIAAYFDRNVRTIGRCIKIARKMGLGVPTSITPQDIVDEVKNHFLELKADVLDLKKQAKAENNSKLLLHSIKVLRDLELARIAALEKIGYFDNYSFPPLHTPNCRAALAQKISAEAQRAETIRVEGPIIEGAACRHSSG